MANPFETLEVMCLTSCELAYLNQLIWAMQNLSWYNNISNFSLLIDKNAEFLAQFETMQTKYSLTHPNNLFDIKNEDREDIYFTCKYIRENVHNLHEKLMSAIDLTASVHSKKYQSYMGYALKVAKEYYNKFVESKNKNLSNPQMETNCLTLEKLTKDLFKVYNFQLLCGQLDKLKQSINVLPDEYEKLDRDDVLQKVKAVELTYLSKLKQLVLLVINSTSYLYDPQYDIGALYNQIIIITSEHVPKTFSFYKPTFDSILDKVIDFLKARIDFFAAPFTTNQFQIWALENENEVKPLSDGLKSYLRSEDQLDMYIRSLVGESETDTNCLKAGNDLLIRRMLQHASAKDLVIFLANQMNNPIINKWYADNLTHNLSLKT